MIIGVGIDSIEIARVGEAVDLNPGFMVFTPRGANCPQGKERPGWAALAVKEGL